MSGRRRWLWKRRAVKVDFKRRDLFVPYFEHFGDVAFNCWATGRLELVSRQSARPVSINNQVFDLHRGDHREETTSGLQLCTFPHHLFDWSDKAGECHAISQECLPATLLLETIEIRSNGVFGRHVGPSRLRTAIVRVRGLASELSGPPPPPSDEEKLGRPAGPLKRRAGHRYVTRELMSLL